MATDPYKPELPSGREGEKRSKWLLGLLALLLFWWAWLRRFLPGRAAPAYPKSAAALRGAPSKGHELRDANPAWIFGLVLLLGLIILAAHGILAGFLNFLNHRPMPQDAWRPWRRQSHASAAAPSFPRLQISAPRDLQNFRRREEEELHSYGWVDRRAGIVRIPIEQAMDEVVRQGLPVRTGTNDQQAGPSSYELIRQRSENRRPEGPK